MPATNLNFDEYLVGFRKLIGLNLLELQEGSAMMELEIGAEHLNSQGSIHGGIMATMIDHAGGMAGCLCQETGRIRKAVTLSLTTSFLAPAAEGKIMATGRKRPGGRRIFVSTVEITDVTGKLLAVGEATYRYIKDQRSVDRIQESE
ncbi:MAG: PaaI family thioesterase [Deltaproteobacteria bacterium HGW-Deltaproteobacteria-23]|nr:MAG: PaaI family thioesterase [Deltaproteobacteria bacterium HGW-Deltaproteobacteria-23]